MTRDLRRELLTLKAELHLWKAEALRNRQRVDNANGDTMLDYYILADDRISSIIAERWGLK